MQSRFGAALARAHAHSVGAALGISAADGVLTVVTLRRDMTLSLALVSWVRIALLYGLLAVSLAILLWLPLAACKLFRRQARGASTVHALWAQALVLAASMAVAWPLGHRLHLLIREPILAAGGMALGVAAIVAGAIRVWPVIETISERVDARLATALARLGPRALAMSPLRNSVSARVVLSLLGGLTWLGLQRSSWPLHALHAQHGRWLWLAMAAWVGSAAGVALLPGGVSWRRVGLLGVALTSAPLLVWRDDVGAKYAILAASPAGRQLFAAVRWTTDFDRDGFGFLLGENDCAPFSATVHPLAPELAGNGIDENCDGHDQRLAAEASPVIATPAALVRPWNILLLTIDTVRYDRTSFGGYLARTGRDTTPNLATLAATKAVSFTRAYASAAGTMASIPAILTSKYFHSGIALDEQVPRGRPPRIADANLLLTEVMAQGGYVTGVIASHDYWNGWGLEQGVRDYDNTLGRHRDPFASPAKAVTERALAWVAGQGVAPWFLWAHYIDPHGRYVAHPDVVDWGSSEPDLYDAELRWTDVHVGRLLAELARLPSADRTIVIITSDHGDSMGEHNIPVGTHGSGLYEEQIHVPLMFVVPGLPPRQLDGAVSNLDIFPTVAALTGQPLPGDLEGRNVAPQLLSGVADMERIVFAETNLPHPQRAAIGAYGKVIFHLQANVAEHYDLRADPHETRNQATTPTPDAERLRRALDAWLARVAFSRNLQTNQLARQTNGALLVQRPQPRFTLIREVAPGVRLLGFDVGMLLGPAAGGLTLHPYFEITGAVPGGLQFGLRITQAGGVARHRIAPRRTAAGVFLPETWRPGDYIRESFHVPWEEVVKGARFELLVTAADTSAGVPLGFLAP